MTQEFSLTTPPRIEHGLGASLRQAAAEAPQHAFIRMLHGEWTYGAFDHLSDRVARGLQQAGVRQADNVSLLLPNCIEFAATWFGLAKLGAVAAPVSTSFRGVVLAQAIDLVQSHVAIVHEDWLAALAEVASELSIRTLIVVPRHPGTALNDTPPALEGMVLHGWDDLLALGDAAADMAWPEVKATDLCLLLYTSGSTGRSKAAMLSHRYVHTHAQLTAEGLGLRADDVLYCPYPMFHIDSAIMTVAAALHLRGVAAIGEKFSVSRYWDEMRALRATVFDFMGATLTMLWKQAPSDRDRDHFARLGWGVPLPAWAPEFEQRFGCKLVELYGLTEAGVMLFTPLDRPSPVGACGQPRGPFELALVDEAGWPVADGEPGELLIRPQAPSVMMSGYYGMPEASLNAFKDLWFHTGDVLRRDAQGFYFFVGRRKDVLRRRGENISAAEVEMLIDQHPEVLESAVYGVPSELSEDEVMACVALRPHSSLSAAALAAFCEQHMARFMVPRYIRFMAELPKTPTDKVEKFKLRDQGVTADTWDRESHPS
jgi:crotonobetaine/carnitine-CoA ligase